MKIDFELSLKVSKSSIDLSFNVNNLFQRYGLLTEFLNFHINKLCLRLMLIVLENLVEYKWLGS